MNTDEPAMSPEERRRFLEQLPSSTPLTLARAAHLAGYRSVSALRTAALEGRLRVDRHGPRNVLTTAGALLSYLGTLHNKGAARGRPRRKPSGIAAGEAGE